MQEPSQNQSSILADAAICGVIGGTIAYATGEDIQTWAMLSVVAGPLFVLLVSMLTDMLADMLPGAFPASRGRYYGFAAFAFAALLLALIARLVR